MRHTSCVPRRRRRRRRNPSLFRRESVCTGNLPTLVIISSSLALLDGNESNQIKQSNHITSMTGIGGTTQRNPNLPGNLPTPNILFIYINHIIHIITFTHFPSFLTSFPRSSFNLNNTPGNLSLSYPRPSPLSPVFFPFSISSFSSCSVLSCSSHPYYPIPSPTPLGTTKVPI